MAEKRNRVTSEYQKQRRAFRNHSHRHVLVLETDLDEDEKRRLFAMGNRLRLASNEVVSIMEKRLRQMFRTKEYRGVLKAYGKEKEAAKGEETPELLVLKNKLQKIQKRFGLTKKDCEKAMEEIYPKLDLNSQIAQARALDIWAGVKKVLYSSGRHLRFKKKGEYPEISGTQYDRAIVLKPDFENHRLTFTMDGLAKKQDTVKNEDGTKSTIIKKASLVFTYLEPEESDLFAREETEAILCYLENSEEIDRKAVGLYTRCGKVSDTFRPCCVSLVCKEIRGKKRVYIHITLEGDPLPKKKKDGTIRHIPGTGHVGYDPGAQSGAYTSDYDCGLFNIGQRNPKKDIVVSHEKAIIKRQRAMDRSRRAMNPKNYNEDGTIKKGKKSWIKSNTYKKNEYLVHEMMRKDAESRKYAQLEKANELRRQGDVLILEKKNAKALQRRSKKTERQEKVSVIWKKDGSAKPVRKYKKKKRFGRSCLRRAPGQQQAILEKKFPTVYVVPARYRASQYEHIIDDYVKKQLSDRIFELKNSKIKVQRDWYSSFLLYCYDPLTDDIDKERAKAIFQTHWERHNYRILEGLKHLPYEVKNSGIKPGV